MITPDSFVLKIIMQDYDGVKKAIEEGFDINVKIPGKVPIVESAQSEEDYKMLYILWRAGAKPTTPWLYEVFEGFEKGIMPQKVKKELPRNMKRLNTNTFSVKKLNISNGQLFLCDYSCRIELSIKPFELDGEVIETTIFIEDIALPIDVCNIENKAFSFAYYPQEGYIDSSMYLKKIHNPITVKTITFKEYDKHSNTIRAEFDMIFDFEVIDLKNETYRFSTVLFIK